MSGILGIWRSGEEPRNTTSFSQTCAQKEKGFRIHNLPPLSVCICSAAPSSAERKAYLAAPALQLSSSRWLTPPMGKAWRNGKGGDAKAHDVPSCKGYPVVMGTCDAARERETSKELVNLLNDAIEELYPAAVSAPAGDQPHASASMSIEEMMRAEIEQVKSQKHAVTQNVVSVNTGVKGITLIKILRKECCPVKLVQHIFDKVEREKSAVCRFVVRIVPFQTVFFPEREEVVSNFRTLMRASLGLPPLPDTRSKKRSAEENAVAGDGDDNQEGEAQEGEGPSQEGEAASPPEHKKQRTDEHPVPTEAESPAEVPSTHNDPSPALPAAEAEVWQGTRIPYYVMFKARNHNVLGRDAVLSAVQECMSPYGYGDFRTPQVRQHPVLIIFMCACGYLHRILRPHRWGASYSSARRPLGMSRCRNY